MRRKTLSRSAIAFIFVALASQSGIVFADTAKEIEIRVAAALQRFVEEVDAGQAFLDASKGVLIFPSVLKAGFGIGGEYGEGALQVNGKTVDYYNTAAASIGFQIGVQTKTIILMFIENDALESFRGSDGWEVGVDGAVALIEIGVGGSIDTSNITDPVIGFVLSNKGLMYNLTLEGSKMTKIQP
jgi:lipid-binding SYLF domain-containing protein